MKRLGIVVPRYNEDEKIIKPLLDSIRLQQGIDLNEVEIIIVNDGSDKLLDMDFINEYEELNIRMVAIEHSGVSEARNVGMDMCDAEYIMFCDADDCFYNVCAFKIIFDEIDKSDFEVMTSDFVEESYNKELDQTKFIVRQSDATFIHGKIYNKQYLINNNIRWNKKLTLHEDSYFNCLAINMSENARHTAVPFYLWKYRKDSVCRKDPKFIYKTFVKMIDSQDAVVQQFLKRNMLDKAQFYVCNFTFDVFYMLNKDDWNDYENEKYKEKTEKRFSKFFKKYIDIFNSTNIKIKNEIQKGSMIRATNTGFVNQIITFGVWISKIIGMAR